MLRGIRQSVMALINMSLTLSMRHGYIEHGASNMSRKARHNARIRARILGAAGAAFRASGYAGARIDDIMAAAGLTRGAFYAHFTSKSALWTAVFEEDDLLLKLLRQRSTAAPDALARGALHIFAAILDPRHLASVRTGWGLPYLAPERPAPGRAGERGGGEGFAALTAATLEELARGSGQSAGAPGFAAALAQATGAIRLAGGIADPIARDMVLMSLRQTVLTGLRDAYGLSPEPPLPRLSGALRVEGPRPGSGPPPERIGLAKTAAFA